MKTFRISAFFIFFSFSFLSAQGKVYLVLGSDTAIWDGLQPVVYNCTYDLSLYSDPQKNGYKVMSPEFRTKIKDSYGETLKMTWWMMAGNVFRNATNRNIPVPNTMTLYSMKKWEGEWIKQYGDELSLHYHTFWWTDYDGDGKYWWNQAKSFNECRDDFDITLAQFLLEENTFPVSFRTGWHAMENEWQNYLDDLIPYSMHNDYPGKHTDSVEPLDNLYDWSKSSPEFVPFHPSLQDYQLTGNGQSWNVRSIYMASIKQAQMDTIFAKAKRGIDQVACIWAHLPEEDFLDNIKRVDSLAHISAGRFPAVKFDYCTAVEAMQKWRKGDDNTPPVIDITEERSGENSYYSISVNEPVFQKEPFFAVKDIYENYRIIHCIKTGENKWRTTVPVITARMAKAGAAVCDTLGNLSTRFINYLADEIFVDNSDADYSEKEGSWTTINEKAWGTDIRQCILGASDSAKAVWTAGITKSGLYNIFFQVPKTAGQISKINFNIYSGQNLLKSISINSPVTAKDWVYIASAELDAGIPVQVEMSARGEGSASRYLYADVIRISSLVKDKSVFTLQKNITLGDVSEEDSVKIQLKLENRGIKPLTVTKINSLKNTVLPLNSFPCVIQGMGSLNIPLYFYSLNRGEIQDSLLVSSDDPLIPVLKLYFSANVKPYFTICDNNDTASYSEKGNWNFSSAEGWAGSSRWAAINQGAWAQFRLKLRKSGLYEVHQIVPATVNAVASAAYIISSGGRLVDTVKINQNTDSGNFTLLGKYKFTAGLPVDVKVQEYGKNSGNAVLRADAVRFSYIETSGAAESEGNPADYELFQNFPNPFNNSTIIRFQVPPGLNGEGQNVEVKVFDILGTEIATLISENRRPGVYQVVFKGNNLASGIYFCRLKSDNMIRINKMLLLR